LRGPVEDRVGVAQVGVDVLGGTCLVAGEQRAGVGEDDRVGSCSSTLVGQFHLREQHGPLTARMDFNLPRVPKDPFSDQPPGKLRPGTKE
jgi:hypothetical protein